MARPSNCALTLISLLVSIDFVRGHEHHDELTEAEANLPTDTILWIHIFLQAAVWGVLFPIGMVLGISYVQLRHYLAFPQRNLQSEPMARPAAGALEFRSNLARKSTSNPECWVLINCRRVHPRPLPWRTPVPAVCPRNIRVAALHPDRRPTGARHIPQAAHP